MPSVCRGPATMIYVLVLFLHAACGKTIHSFAGPYIVYADRFYNSEKEDCPWKWNIRVSHFNPQKPSELQILSGNITGKDILISDKTWMHIVMDLRSNNAWKENAFIFDFKDKACSVAQKCIPGFFKMFFGELVKQRGSCTIDPDFYSTDKQPIDWTFPTFPVMPYGHYRFKLTTGNAKVKAMCFVAECHVIPKLK